MEHSPRMPAIEIDPASTALVLIDLQNGIVSRPVVPHSSADVLAHAASLAAALRATGGTVVYVHVDINNMLSLPVDTPTRDPNAPPPPASVMELAPNCGIAEGDLRVTKRSWGAFYGTELDQLLRRRNIRTIILGGIATNIGVESTARAAFDHGYALIFAEDAMSSIAAEARAFAIKTIFPRMGRVRSTAEILEALQKDVAK